MSTRELVAKTAVLAAVTLSCLISGVLVLVGPHAANDYVNGFMGLSLVGFAVIIGGVGTMMIVGVIADNRARRQEEELHVAPRTGPLAPPPAWGMAEVGRPHHLPPTANRPATGGGQPKVMSVRTSNIDGPIVVIALLIWAAVFTLVLAPK